ncbi:MAG: NUDIX hydrolase [Phycisphaerales bacterium]|nr:NUDIX hydrolase [Phycisphaerales bacterium]
MIETECPRKTGLKNGLRQLTTAQLHRVLSWPHPMVTDTYNYDNGCYCPLAIGAEIDKRANLRTATHDVVFCELQAMGFKVNNTRGIKGDFYTTERERDLKIALQEVILERGVRQLIPIVAATFAGRLLMLQRRCDSKYPNAWCVPGGKIEEGESVVQCAKREFCEETGITATIEPLDEIDLGDTFRFAIYQAQFMGEFPPSVRIEQDKFQGFGWFTTEELITIAPMQPAVFIMERLGYGPPIAEEK